MHIFTSITANYLPKAMVLAQSCKKYNPNFNFSLILAEREIPHWLPEDHPFDQIILASKLDIPDFDQWAFHHSVVELCTAIKGPACQYLHQHLGAQKIVYLDPDIAVFHSLEPLSQLLDQHELLLTPHQTKPETDDRAIIDNEICSLKHGVFNLGFLAITTKGDGARFMNWWADRLIKHCYDDIPNGLFTDQRWVDLAPCFFPGLHVLRKPNYNVATWNINQRDFSGDLDTGILVNGEPLIFYHFSGYDSGDYATMLRVYGQGRPQLKSLKNWYAKKLAKTGQDKYGKTPCSYGFFDNGQPITDYHRFIYRTRLDLQDYFPSPWQTTNVDQSYAHWFQAHIGDQAPDHCPAVLRSEYARLQQELFSITNSRTWKILCALRRIYRRFHA